MTELATPSASPSAGWPEHQAVAPEPLVDACFQSVFDNAPIGRIASDLAGVVTSVNDRLAGMMGYTTAQIMGRPIHDFLPPTDQAEVRAAAQVLLEGDDNSTELASRRLLHRDGQAVPVSVTSALLRDEAGQPNGWASLVLDLSEEEQARTDLERAHVAALSSAERVRLLQEVATAANEADSVERVAPTLLALVCAHFGWTAGCLVKEANGTTATAPDVIDRLGEYEILLEAYRASVPAVAGAVRVADGPAGRVIVVPLVTAGRTRLAWLFPAGPTDLGTEQVEILATIGIETARVAERADSAAQIRDSEARFRSVFGASPLPMGVTLGSSGTYADVNQALCELVGRTPEELIGHSAMDICHPDDIVLADPAGAAAAAAPDGRHQFEMRLLHSSGEVLITVITLAWIDGADGTPQLLAQIQDITARRSVEESLRHHAAHDALTGLANRAQLTRTLASRAGSGTAYVVLFIDIDGFKLINATRGHDIGDEVLINVAERLRGAVRPDDLVVRFGGDEFIVLCELDGVVDPLGLASCTADRVEAALRPPMPTATGPAEVTVSIGIAEGRVDRTNPQRLLQRADAAMNQAKQLGRDRRAFYDVPLHRRSLSQIRTEASLRTALDDDRFTVHFQPIVDLTDRSVLGFEALVRLVDERGNLVPPGDFISVAEQSGLIVPMGTWVLRQSCQALARLRQETGRPLTVSVNIAARQMVRDDLSGIVLGALEDAGLPEHALSLELTESAMLEAATSTLDQLNLLRERGVTISLDDFGTGYSSLTYLRQLPVSCLKIDRSFVGDMIGAGGAGPIVRSVARLAQELDLRWIAEGIETEEQLDLLRALGPGLGQGYLFSRPLPVDRLSHLLAQGEPA